MTFALLATAFLIKAAVVPWHFWLPDAYGAAPAPVCVLLAGVMSELGIFGLARTLGNRLRRGGRCVARASNPPRPGGAGTP